MENKNQILEQVLEIENKELNGSVDEFLYLKKIELLCLLANREPERVWGEYNIVQEITTQPVLMNKAMSIPLTKNEVALLIDDLKKKFAKNLKANKTENVNLVFSTTIRGHANNVSKEIVLPKLGDWRFGYTDQYSAELVFHEFSHLLDYGRIKIQKYGKTDIHKHDFVRILDNMLIMYSEFIESKYIPSRQRKQIINNSNLLTDFYVNKEEIESKDKEREILELAKKKELVEELKKESGISEDSFPIHFLIEENKENKIKYLEYILSNYEKNTPISLQLKSDLKEIRESLQSDKSIINKSQIDILVKALDKSKLNDYLLELPLMQQLKMSSVLKQFNQDIRNLSIGKLESIEQKDSFKTITYEDSEKLKKSGFKE
jgi:hypothetical protein